MASEDGEKELKHRSTTRETANGDASSSASPPKPPPRRLSYRLLVPLFFALTALLLLPTLLPSLNIPSLSLSSLSLATPDTNTRFFLSPSSHSTRKPEVRKYEFVLREETRWPDGVQKRVFTINGLLPGPTIEARSGDTLHLTVHNELEEGTSIHFHGLRHPDGTVSQDGSIGLTQCPIPPNGTMTYEFRIADDQQGTFWYHSHHATQRADGLFGAFIIHRPAPPLPKKIDHHEPRFSRTGARLAPRTAEVERRRVGDVEWDDEFVLMVGDWFHRTGKQMFDWYWNRGSGGMEPVPDNALINGVQLYDCPRSVRRITCDASLGQRPTYTLSPSRTYLLRLINTGSIAQAFISVDEHELLVLEADGTDIEPIVVKELAIAPGQRYGVVLLYVGEGRKEGRAFWFRHRLDQSCFKYPNLALDPQPKGIIQYAAPRTLSSFFGLFSSPSDDPAHAEPTTAKWNVSSEEEFDARTLQPLSAAARYLPPPTRDPILLFANTVKYPQNGHLPWGYINSTSWRPNERAPLMLQKEPEEWWVPERWGENEFVVSLRGNESVVVVDVIVNNLEDGEHPFHLHGHHFWPLYVGQSARYGWGSYNWAYPPTLPTTAPALRDTVLIPHRSYAVFRVRFDTPGMWMFHCHVLVHLKSGMAMAFDVMRDRVPERERERVREGCRAYAGLES